MLVEVIKKGGRRESFRIAKLARSIERASRDAVKEVARVVSRSVQKSLRGKRAIRSSELRRRTLARLQKSYRAAAAAWRKYERRR